jgi:hypothetical protein
MLVLLQVRSALILHQSRITQQRRIAAQHQEAASVTEVTHWAGLKLRHSSMPITSCVPHRMRLSSTT